MFLCYISSSIFSMMGFIRNGHMTDHWVGAPKQIEPSSWWWESNLFIRLKTNNAILNVLVPILLYFVLFLWLRMPEMKLLDQKKPKTCIILCFLKHLPEFISRISPWFSQASAINECYSTAPLLALNIIFKLLRYERTVLFLLKPKSLFKLRHFL